MLADEACSKARIYGVSIKYKGFGMAITRGLK